MNDTDAEFENIPNIGESMETHVASPDDDDLSVGADVDVDLDITSNQGDDGQLILQQVDGPNVIEESDYRGGYSSHYQNIDMNEPDLVRFARFVVEKWILFRILLAKVFSQIASVPPALALIVARVVVSAWTSYDAFSRSKTAAVFLFVFVLFAWGFRLQYKHDTELNKATRDLLDEKDKQYTKLNKVIRDLQAKQDKHDKVIRDLQAEQDRLVGQLVLDCSSGEEAKPDAVVMKSDILKPVWQLIGKTDIVSRREFAEAERMIEEGENRRGEGDLGSDSLDEKFLFDVSQEVFTG